MEVVIGIKLRYNIGERGDDEGGEQRATSGAKRSSDRSLSRSPFFQGCGFVLFDDKLFLFFPSLDFLFVCVNLFRLILLLHISLD